MTRDRSTFTESDLLCAVATEAQYHGIGADVISESVKETLKQSEEIVSLGIDTSKPRVLEVGGVGADEKPVLSEPGAIRYTTQEIVELELSMLDRVEASKTQESVTASDRAFSQAIKERPTIKEEQTEMVKYLTQGQGRIKSVVGDAGTGKTFALEAVKEALEAEGKQVLGCALAGIAAKGMSDVGIESRTIASTLWWIENQPDNPKGVSLDKNTMLIVDEAGMVDTRQMAKLIEHTENAGSTLVLVGDHKQLQPIELGGSFKEIVELTEGVRLQDIFRQEKEGDREAVKNISMGNAKEFLSYHLLEGNLRIAEDRFDAKEQLIEDYKNMGGLESPDKNLIFCCTNSDVTFLNRAIQNERLAAKEIGGDFVSVDNDVIYEGDRIIFTKPDKW